jgi:hypothetical protein
LQRFDEGFFGRHLHGGAPLNVRKMAARIAVLLMGLI